MIVIQRPGTSPLEAEYLLIDFEGTLASDRRVNPKAKDRINLLAKRLKVTIFARSEREWVESVLRKVKADIVYVPEGAAAQGKLDLLKRLGREKAVAIGNGADDIPVLQETALGICILGREGAAGGAFTKADLVFTDILHALDFLLKPLRQKTTLGL